MIPLIIAVFIASLLGSLHCVGMCGPLALLANGSSRFRQRWPSIVSYHSGRLVAYSLAGAIAGGLGAGVQWSGQWVGAQQLAAKLAGGSMLVVGLLSLVQLAGGTSHQAWIPAKFHSALSKAHAWARKQPPKRRAAAIGVLTAILPCGWLYAFMLVAAGTASSWNGMAVMAVFSLGSVPALAGMALSVNSLMGRFRTAVPWLSATLIVVVGAMTVVQRADIDSTGKRRFPSMISLENLVQQVGQWNHQEMPCCIPPENSAAADIVQP